MKSSVGASLIALGMLSTASAAEMPVVFSIVPQEPPSLFVRRMLATANSSDAPNQAQAQAPAPQNVSADEALSPKQQSEEEPADILARLLNTDKSLRALDADLSIAYGRALNRVNGHAIIAKQLASEQAGFLEYKETAAYLGIDRLKQLMKTWTSMLNVIDAPHKSFAGVWTSSGGNVQITLRKEGGYHVAATADMPVTGDFHCELEGTGRINGEIMTVTGEGISDDYLMGWTVTLKHIGGLLHMEQQRNNSEYESPPFCGAIDLLGGDYMPASANPGTVKSW